MRLKQRSRVVFRDQRALRDKSFMRMARMISGMISGVISGRVMADVVMTEARP